MDSVSSVYITNSDISESISIIDDSNSFLIAVVTISETSSIVDTISNTANMFSVIIENIFASDITDDFNNTTSTDTEILSATDHSNTANSIFVGNNTETLNTIDTTNSVLIASVSISENISSSDVTDSVYVTVANIIETTTTTDMVSYSYIGSGIVTESMNTVVSTSAANIMFSNITETTFTDDIANSQVIYNEIITETINAIDSVVSTLITNSSISEHTSLIDTATTFGSDLNSNITEQLISSISCNTASSIFSGTVIENETIIDVADGFSIINVDITESCDTEDTITVNFTYDANIIEIIGNGSRPSLICSTNENIYIHDCVNAGLNFHFSMNENLTIDDHVDAMIFNAMIITRSPIMGGGGFLRPSKSTRKPQTIEPEKTEKESESNLLRIYIDSIDITESNEKEIVIPLEEEYIEEENIPLLKNLADYNIVQEDIKRKRIIMEDDLLLLV